MTERGSDIRSAHALQSHFEAAELDVLEALGVEDHLTRLTATREGLKSFIASFYFCRVGFVKANFILGARCPADERYWLGLARNLYEEAGGGDTPAHNTLYRRLIDAYCQIPEADLCPPPFAKRFDDAWIEIASAAPLEEALLAFAIYEALDAPDYQMLYRAISPHVECESTLAFFKVHTEARHVELFTDVLSLLPCDSWENKVMQVGHMVLGLQSDMWRGLLRHLE